jgi:hypothetical protein
MVDVFTMHRGKKSNKPKKMMVVHMDHIVPSPLNYSEQ